MFSTQIQPSTWGKPLPARVEVERRRHSSDRAWTYELLDHRQREIATRVREGGQGALLLSELAPVITRGRRAPSGDITASNAELAGVGVSLVEVDRGGLATYHGPGQWVLFPVDRLEALTGDPRGVRKAVQGLLEIALQVGRLYDSTAEIRSGAELGVWTRRGKFAAVGVHVQQGVLLHGLAINGMRTPTSFYGLRPCGLDAPVDFLLDQEILASDPELMFQVRERLFGQLGESILKAALAHFWG